jgi:two-component system phosphate regulon sensor histidine kinase PhoR
MLERKSLGFPITLGVVLIVLLVLLIVGWVVLAVAVLSSTESFSLAVTLLSVGAVGLIVVLVGVVLYLTLTVKAINLNRRQSNFIDSVTHELKSPIASLKLYLQTLSRRAVSEEKRKDFCQVMLEDVERLDQLINHLLDAARLEKAPADVEEETLSLTSLLGEVAESICVQYGLPLSTVTLNLEDCTVEAVRVNLDILFRNLLDNAVKYAHSPPEVFVSLQSSADDIVVRIADNGPGIPREQRRKIFGRFERLGLELERTKSGTGLGLHIVRTIVRKLKGRVKVMDREDESGTLFEVRLPAKMIVPRQSDPLPLSNETAEQNLPQSEPIIHQPN